MTGCPRCVALEAELARLRPPAWRPVAEVVVEVATVSEANSRDHHHTRAARVRRQREAVTSRLEGLHPEDRYHLAARRVRCTLTRLGARALDDDNLTGALKGVRDAVAAWLGCDDGPSGPVTWAYGQEAHRRWALRPGVRITLEAA